MRVKRGIAGLLTVTLCASTLLQPLSVYAASLDAYAAPQMVDASQFEEADGMKSDSAAGEAGTSADEGLTDKAPVSPEDASQAQSDKNTDTEPIDSANAAAEVTEPADDASASEAETPRKYVANSWRYENGSPIAVEGDNGISTLAMGQLPQGANAQGIDVSEFQGEIDWDAVKAAGIDFAIIRIGWGGQTWGREDYSWQRNVAECERLDIPWGAYLYSYATDTTEANQEADRTINTLNAARAKGYEPTLPVYYDMEDKLLPSDHQELAAIAKTYCDRVGAAGYEPGVYANLNWWTTRLTDSVFNSWDRWVAQYNVGCDYQGSYSAWQYTSSGKVPGISGNVDMNYWYGEPVTNRLILDELARDNRKAIADDTYAIVPGDVSRRMALDVSAGSTNNNANVQIWSTNATSAQRWKVSHDANGYVTFTNVKSGKVLDVAGGVSNPGVNVAQYDSNGTWAQKWVVVPDGSGYRIVSALDPELVLDVASGKFVDGSNIQIYTANGSAAQRFSFFDATPNVSAGDTSLSEDSMFVLEPASASGKALDIASASTADGANVQIYAANGTFAQLFAFERVSGGYYQIRIAQSGKVLDVDKGDVVPGANVQQWDSDASNANAQFAVKRNGNGTYSFINRASGLALTVDGTGDCSNVSARAFTGSSSQCFRLIEREHLIEDGVYSIASSSNSSLVFDVQGASTAENAPVQLYSSNGSFAQKWSIALVGGTKNTYTIESLASGKRLAAASTGAVVQSTPGNEKNQQWIATIYKGSFVFKNAAYSSYELGVSKAASGSALRLASYSDLNLASFRLSNSNDAVADGGYYIGMASAPNAVVDVASGSLSNGANVQVYAKNGTNAQKWVFESNGDGTYTIMNAGSGKVLDVKNGAAYAGANVQQYERNGSWAQRWYVGYRGGGFKITSALDTAFCLDVSGASSNNGTNLQLYSSNNSRGAQRFVLIPTSYEMPYRGFQNPSQYYQVSNKSVNIPHLGEGTFGYRTESKISATATKQDCINAEITRALDYVGTPYIWDYSCAPGVGVDCAGLVMQALYATGMDLSPMNPWDHYYTPGHDQYANFMWTSGRFQKLSFDQRRGGDLISYNGRVAIYLGNDQIVEAYPNVGVRVGSVYAPGSPRGVMRPFV